MQFLSILIWSLLGTFTATVATETDLACLRSIKASSEDPFGYLKSSWDLNNNSEGHISSFTGVECWHQEENKVLSLTLPGLGLRGGFPLGIQNCHIPEQIGWLTRIKTFNVSNNLLSGPVPRFQNATISADSYTNNVGFCGRRWTNA
ncbi:hypothetical protein GH714_021194 [Hevea brasiliensis]|uniref:Leucine-rich repeat-containing N-terminal plant-type domain-containing protein n=1 Tax=Hevea brasiliensis TaxID=3981 RepID=A0A6A6LDA0_HEVBR|nr:hypothetical protein GH714_021194 [Hevea brasiliensis]